MNRKSVFIFLIVFGVSSIITCIRLPTVKGIIWIEGHITSDTTWPPVDTYRVINNTYVDPGVTLTIEPGVRIEVGDGFSLIIEGGLSAVGTEADPIVFTSTPRPSPSPGTWNTIKFQGNSSEQFLLKHAKIEFASDGVTVASLGKSEIEKSEIYNCSVSGIMIKGRRSNVVIKENTIKSNNHGVSTDNSGHSGIAVINNEITANDKMGLRIYSNEWTLPMCNITVADNTVTSNGNDGIHLENWNSESPTCNISLSGNTVSFNGGTGIYLGAIANWNGNPMYNINISSNTVSSNGEDGIRIYNDRSNSTYNVFVSDNTVSSNGGHGLSLESNKPIYVVAITSNTFASNGGHGVSLSGPQIYVITFFENTVFSNDCGIRAAGGNYLLLFDLWILENVLSANNVGVEISGTAKVNMSRNSISYNTNGVRYFTTTNNLAKFNDIYENSYGMKVESSASVDAEYNYWGHSTGPYHYLNPEGEGNPVNGDGTDLDFIPFLTSKIGTINERPVAVLEVDKTCRNVNETVTFDATGSTDDGRIDYYFFDFGDGENSGWATLPVVTHKYAQEGEYNATLIVMDDFGVTSLDGNLVYVEITVVPEFSSMLILPLFMIATLLGVIVYRRKHSVVSVCQEQ